MKVPKDCEKCIMLQDGHCADGNLDIICAPHLEEREP